MKNKNPHVNPETKRIKKTAIFLFTVFLCNLGVATALALAEREWSPSTGLVIANAEASPTSSGSQNRTRIVRSDFSGTPYYIAFWVEDGGQFIKAQKYNENGLAQWSPSSGVAVYNGTTTSPNTSTIDTLATNVVGVPDGNGGIIIAWSDSRNNDFAGNGYDVFGLHLEQDGTIASGWTGVNGIRLVDSGVNDYLYSAVSDETGGITLAYGQQNGPFNFPFVHRIDGNGAGHSGWTANTGTDVSGGFGINTGTSYNIITAADGGDGDSDMEYILSWGTAGQIAKLNSTGSIEWGPTNPIGGSTGNLMLHDGSGGVYYVTHINIIHLDSNGNSDACFGDTDGLPCDAGTVLFDTADTSFTPQIISDNASGMIVTWQINSPGRIRAQRFNSAGIEQWDGDIGTGGNQPITVSHSSGDALTPIIKADGSGGAYIAWEDSRNTSSSGVDIYAQHINSTGTLTFGGGITDVQITTLTGTDSLKPENIPNPGGDTTSQNSIAITSTNGFLIAWDNLTVNDNFIQKVETSGSIQLGDTGQSLLPTSATSANQNGQKIVHFGDGTFVIAWIETKNGNNDIYAQKVDTSGNYLWPSSSPAINGTSIVNAPGNQPNSGDSFSLMPVLSSDANQRGVILVWSDTRTNSDIYALRLKTDGTPFSGWSSNGNIVSDDTSPLTKNRPVLTSNGSNGAIIAWEEEVPTIDFPRPAIKAQNISSSGTLLWDTDGGSPGSQPVNITNDTDNINETLPEIIMDGSSGAIIAYEKSGADENIEAARITNSGTVSWNSALANTANSENGVNIISDSNNGIIASYLYNTGAEVRAQRLDGSGSKLWATDGVIIATAASTRSNAYLVSDNVTPANGAIISWEDERSGNKDIFAQRINSNGVAQWEANGIAVSNITDSLDQETPAIISNSANGAIITFQSNPGSGLKNIYAQHINGLGTAQWTANGELVETDTARIDRNPVLASDNNAGAVITWDGETSGTTDVFAQYLRDSLGAACAEGGSESFCGQQEIRNAILSFFDIPDSFTFPSLTVASTAQSVFNNTDPLNPTGTENLDDLLTIQDSRDSGGFIVQLSAEGNFTDGSDTIPINNLYVVTSTSTNLTGYTPVNGVIYEDIITNPAVQNIGTPVHAGGNSADVNNSTTYMSLLPNTQFTASGTINIMEGTLSSSLGRNGKMSQFVSFYLNVPALQPAGDYSVILTYTLFDDTTP